MYPFKYNRSATCIVSYTINRKNAKYIGSHAENSARQLQELHCIDRERSNFCVFGRVDTGDSDGLGVLEKRMEQMASLQIHSP